MEGSLKKFWTKSTKEAWQKSLQELREGVKGDEEVPERVQEEFLRESLKESRMKFLKRML